MTQKPKIQYIGQFYVPGSEAQVLAPKEKKKKPKTKLPSAKREKVEVVYIDPVALVGILVAVVMLGAMVFGAVRIQSDWNQYEEASQSVSQLKHENAILSHSYRSQYDLDDIREKALAIGMVPKEEVENKTMQVTVPQREPEPTLWDDIVWFFQGLFA